jgi:hypothetical protein
MFARISLPLTPSMLGFFFDTGPPELSELVQGCG